MKNIFVLTVVLLLTCAGYSQQYDLDSVKNLVISCFNKKDDSSLYNLTGAAFHKELSAETFKKVSKENLFPLGNIKEAKFERVINGASKYKVTADAAVLTMYLSLDSAGKIATFLFQPYKDEAAVKTEKPATSNPLITPLDKKVDEVMGAYIKQLLTVGVSIGILKDGKTYFYNYGETQKGKKQLPTERSIYEIGSISKTFTATLLADAVNAGKVSLDDPISKFLPDSVGKLAFDGVPITLKTLSNHSSGLPRLPDNLYRAGTDNANPYKNYDDAALFSFLKNFKITRKPGTVYEYSNLAAGLLGVILERIDKKSYESLLVNKITGPLQMNDTREYIRKADSGRVAKGYDENGDLSSAWDFKALAAAGGIRSTASDMLKYAAANISATNLQLNKAIQLTHVVTFEPASAKLGLAWHMIKPGNDEILFHNGGTGGYRSYLGINVAKKMAVVILSNAAISDDNEGNGLMKWLESQ